MQGYARQMLALDTKVAKAVWTVLVMLSIAWVLYKLRSVIFLLLLSLFFAYMIIPMVEAVERITPPRWPRKAMIVAVYLATLGLIVVGISEIGKRVVDEARGLTEQLPQLQAKATQYFSDPIPDTMPSWQKRLILFAREQLSASEQRLVPIAKTVGQRALSTVGSALSFLVVPIFAFFFLMQGRRLVDDLLDGLPAHERHFTAGILDEIDVSLGGYIRAHLLLVAITFVVYLVILTSFGIPYSLLLAVTGALLDFLPVVGPLIAFISMTLVAAFTIQKATVWFAILFFAYRLIQDYVIQPRIYARGLKLPPLLLLIGAFAGEHLGGIPGMLLSIPVMAVLKVVIGRMLH